MRHRGLIRSGFACGFAVLAALAGPASPVAAATGDVLSELEIGDAAGDFAGALSDNDGFGNAIAALGDLDGDGIDEIAVGAPGDGDGGTARGAVWILFPSATGAIADEVKISDSAGGFDGVLANFDGFGGALAPLGDLDGDGAPDLAVGAAGASGGQGVVFVLFLNADGSVKSEVALGDGLGGFGGTLGAFDSFGSALAALGDVDGDGVVDLAVGASGSGALFEGAAWVVFLASEGTADGEQKIDPTVGGFGGTLQALDLFGASAAAVGDLDGNGVSELAVGAPGDGGTDRGAVWVLFLDADGLVVDESKINDVSGSFPGQLDANDMFGSGLAGLGDLNGDGLGDVAVGADADDDGGDARGAVWILLLDANGEVGGAPKISDTSGGFMGTLANGDGFGGSVGGLGDIDGDELVDLAVGAPFADGSGSNRGAVWTLTLDGAVARCGDLDGDAAIGLADPARYRAHLADPTGSPLDAFERSRCSVVGGPFDCDLTDVVVLRRALSALEPGAADVCSASGPLP